MGFHSALYPQQETNGKKYWFCFQKNSLLVEIIDDACRLPMVGDEAELPIKPLRTQYLGILDGIDCYSAELPLNIPAPEGMKCLNFFELFARVSEQVYKVAVHAQQITAWDRDHQYCGRCGGSMEGLKNERAKKCPGCGLINFPRITPAMMVAILKGDRILLAKNKNFPEGFYSVLAGFVEPGERLEECITREVKEEVGLSVRNLRYFNSQPWPFPDSLMIAFLADYDSGEIQVDGQEIIEADWYKADELPKCPTGKLSVAGKIIDWFKQEYGPR